VTHIDRQDQNPDQRDASLRRRTEINDLAAPRLETALANAGITVLYQNAEFRYCWAQNIPPGWLTGPIEGLEDDAIFSPDNVRKLETAKREVITGGARNRLEIRHVVGDQEEWLEICLDPEFGPDGEFSGLLMTVRRITDQKVREQALNALLREVSHRSKNLLAIIQSIASQTGRHSDGITDFLGRFRGRIQSLASSQDLVTSSNWHGADLAQLVAGQVGRYCADPARNIELGGENPYLTPNTALHLGLALHELAVNSVSYGALARSDGSVRIGTHRPSSDPERGITFEWSEPIAGVWPEDRRKRFGTVALERVVPASIGSSSTLGVAEGRLVYQLHLPPGSYRQI